MPAEREREREGDRDSKRASEPGTRQLRSDSDSSAAANSRSVKRRDDGGGDPARHDRPRTSGWQSRPSGGRDKDERRDPFRRAKRSFVRSARRSGGRKEGNVGPIRFGDAAPRSEDWRCVFYVLLTDTRSPKELEEKIERARGEGNRGGESNYDEGRHESLIDNSVSLIDGAGETGGSQKEERK